MNNAQLSIDLLRQLEKAEKQLAQLTVENGRWRSLAVSAMRAWAEECPPELDRIMNQIREESTR